MAHWIKRYSGQVSAVSVVISAVALVLVVLVASSITSLFAISEDCSS